MSTTLDIILTSQNGTTLNTEGTYCDKNIAIVPRLEDIVVAPKTEEQMITVSEGYAGIGSVTVEAIQTEEKTVVPTKEVQEVIPEDSYYLSKVTIEPIPDEYIIPFGEMELDSNGIYNVASVGSVKVDVPIPDGYILPSGSQEITENGTYSVSELAEIVVNVSNNEESLTEIIEGGRSVTFLVNDSQYAVSAITENQIINRPTTPVIEGKHFIGWYTAETDGELVSFPYAPLENMTLYARFADSIVVGVTGLTNKDGVLTLTDDVVGLDGYQENQNGNYVSVVSALNDYFPFNEISEFADENGNVFIKFPQLWMKWETNDDGVITGYKFSNGQADEDYFIPDAFLNPSYVTQDTYLPYFALGKYEMSGTSSKGYSKSGATCLTGITRDSARIATHAYGSASNLYNGYQQLDFAQLTLYNLMCMMFYQRSNIQKVYGGRTGAGTVLSWSGASVTGTCDGVDGMNGWNISTDCVKMLGVENPYGNIFKWVDGVYFLGTTIYTHRYPQRYADSSSNANSLGFLRPASSNYITSFKKGVANATRSYIYASAIGDDSNGYCGDYCSYSPSGTVLYTGGSWNFTSVAGLWCLSGGNDASFSGTGIGARLSYRPI